MIYDTPVSSYMYNFCLTLSDNSVRESRDKGLNHNLEGPALSPFLPDIFEDLVSPVVAAQSFLATACQKRRNTLDPVMAFCNQVLNGERDARKKDGVLNVIGQVAETLMKVQKR